MSTRSMAGIAKAAVLPEPVCDWPTMSTPESMTGMAAVWMGEASSYPIFSTARSNSGDKPSSLKGFFSIVSTKAVMACMRAVI